MYFLFFLDVLKQVPIYFCSVGERCKAVLLRRSRNVLWTKNITSSFEEHVDEYLVSEFSTLSELFL